MMRHTRTPRPWKALAGLLLVAPGAAAMTLAAQDSQTALRVEITGITTAEGKVRCALFADPAGFPKNDSLAVQRVEVAPTAPGSVICPFSRVADGRYAISVSQDLNGNGRVDANLVGQPTEPWGVSNGARPRFRPPRFAEAAVDVTSDAATRSISIRIAR